MKISIIVPVYNVESYIGECLRSVIDQTFAEEMECLVVDDCGSDGSMAVAGRLIEEYSGPIKFRILHHDRNRGLSATRNTGIKAAVGDYVTFLDSDDRLFPDSMARMMEVATRYTDTDIIQGDIWLQKPTRFMDFLCVSPVLFPDHCDDRVWCSRSLLTEIPMTAWAKLIRRRFITDNGLYFREGYLHEDDFWRVEAARYIKSVAFCFSPVYFYRNDNSGSIIHYKDKTKGFYSRIKILENLVENFGKSDPEGEYSYLFSALNYANKVVAWPNIENKGLINRELHHLKDMAMKSGIPPLFKFMVRYLCLPPSLGNNLFTRPLYQSFVNRRYNNLIGSIQD